ncbi:MAG: 4-hydroxyphenylpyruvate dioxygenase [Deltaproteobacteria bacterium]|nr:4-hydroxyphenylpyruvate dioxygenase [Deltaproteobacteria bacterium]MBI3296271.1 4-hydroxyphenylpyruvate dioxygenase [Deltaproteobacteria bacterium]
MNDFNQLGIMEVDHVEFAVGNLEQKSALFYSLGFERMGYREITERGLRSLLLGQGKIWIVLTHSTLKSDRACQYVANHGDGILTIAFSCRNAVTALETTVARGAALTESPRKIARDFGQLERASIAGPGDVHHVFLQRTGALFDDGFNEPVREAPPGFGLGRIDHLTVNVEKGRMKDWADFYAKVFGFKNSRTFDIRTDRTGLKSFVMESPDGRIKIPINEPTEDASQIQEFLNIHHGPGVQHMALSTPDILQSVKKLRGLGIAFLEVPDTYYEAVTARVTQISAQIPELRDQRVLADGDASGYLLQIFTQNLVGPFFLEFIQREGNDGFGEGNFQALFEAIELDQERRGVLTARQTSPAQ